MAMRLLRFCCVFVVPFPYAISNSIDGCILNEKKRSLAFWRSCEVANSLFEISLLRRIAKRKLPIMHSTNLALVESIDRQTDQRTTPTWPVPSVQSIHPIVRTQKVTTPKGDAGYHFSFVPDQVACSEWFIVNGRGVPDDTLTAFARELASSAGIEQAQAQLAPLLSYLSEQAQRGLLWYHQTSFLQAAWQEYLRQYAPCREMTGGAVTALAVSAGQGRAVRALRDMLAQFYSFAIARSIYAYQHPFAGRQRFICLPVPSRFRDVFTPRFHPYSAHL